MFTARLTADSYYKGEHLFSGYQPFTFAERVYDRSIHCTAVFPHNNRRVGIYKRCHVAEGNLVF